MLPLCEEREVGSFGVRHHLEVGFPWSIVAGGAVDEVVEVRHRDDFSGDVFLNGCLVTLPHEVVAGAVPTIEVNLMRWAVALDLRASRACSELRGQRSESEKLQEAFVVLQN